MRVAESEALAKIRANLYIRTDECGKTDIYCGVLNEDYIKSLSPTEFQQYRSFLMAHAFRLQNLATQYEYGLLTDEYYERGVIGAVEGFVPRWAAFDVPQGLRLAETLGISIDSQ